MPKKRGAQPKNKNSYKHGFYAKYFSPFEIKALSDIPVTDLTGEIGLLRVQVDRFMQAYTASLKELDYAERLAALRVITLAVGRIAGLERIRSSAGKKIDQYDDFMKLLDSIPEELLDEPDQLPEVLVEPSADEQA